MTPLVICVGNPYRRDDGVGLAVLDGLPDGTRAVEATGEPTDLLNLWSGEDRVVLVDAMSTGAAPGTVHTLTCRSGHWDAAPPAAAASTHGLGVAEAIGLGNALGSVPEQVVLVGVEVSDTGNGVGLTAAVSAAVPGALAAVTDAIQGGR
jgi:hydrogenase maturation protease